MEAMLYFGVLALLTVWATFWVIRLAVRYGMNDALRMNRLADSGERQRRLEEVAIRPIMAAMNAFNSRFPLISPNIVPNEDLLDAYHLQA